MERFLGKYSAHLYALLRVVAGAMFAMHGSQKLFGVPGNKPSVPIGSLLGVAGIVEFVAGVMIAIGLLASFAAFVACGEMAFAFFHAHFPQGFLPIMNGGELAVVYCFLFLYIASHGSGMCAVDSIFLRKKPAA